MGMPKGTVLHHYTEEQKQFIRDNVSGRSRNELARLFNRAFGTDLSPIRIASTIKRLGLATGRDGRFTKGQTSWNKGRLGTHFSPATEFKKGNLPANHRPCGAERINVDGYIEIKVAEPKHWRAKHRYLWEQANGQIPSGHALIFADGNRLNTNLDNLILVTRGELAVLNKGTLPIGGSREITEASLQVARLKIAMQSIKKRGK